MYESYSINHAWQKQNVCCADCVQLPDRSLQDSFPPSSGQHSTRALFCDLSAADLPRNFSILVSISQVKFTDELQELNNIEERLEYRGCFSKYRGAFQVSRTVFYNNADDFSNIADITDFCSNRGKQRGRGIASSWRDSEMNCRRKFREIGSWRTCTWPAQTRFSRDGTAPIGLFRMKTNKLLNLSTIEISPDMRIYFSNSVNWYLNLSLQIGNCQR